MAHPNQQTVVTLQWKNAFATNFLLLKSIYGVILEMAFNMCHFFTDVINVWLEGQFTVKKHT